MTSSSTTSSQQSRDPDDLRHIDSATGPPASSSIESPIVPMVADPPEPEMVTNLPTLRINRPRRAELISGQTCGAPEKTEVITLEEATTSCIGQPDDRNGQLQQMVSLCSFCV